MFVDLQKKTVEFVNFRDPVVKIVFPEMQRVFELIPLVVSVFPYGLVFVEETEDGPVSVMRQFSMWSAGASSASLRRTGNTHCLAPVTQWSSCLLSSEKPVSHQYGSYSENRHQLIGKVIIPLDGTSHCGRAPWLSGKSYVLKCDGGRLL